MSPNCQGRFCNLRPVDGYSNGFDINQIKNIDRRIEMKMQQIKTEIMQQIRAECNCKKWIIIIILIQMNTMMTD